MRKLVYTKQKIGSTQNAIQINVIRIMIKYYIHMICIDVTLECH
jgi:hypothetical protein